MIGIFRNTTAPQTSNPRRQALVANLNAALSALSQATDRSDITELRSRVKALRREIRSLKG